MEADKKREFGKTVRRQPSGEIETEWSSVKQELQEKGQIAVLHATVFVEKKTMMSFCAGLFYYAIS